MANVGDSLHRLCSLQHRIYNLLGSAHVGTTASLRRQRKLELLELVLSQGVGSLPLHLWAPPGHIGNKTISRFKSSFY